MKFLYNFFAIENSAKWTAPVVLVFAILSAILTAIISLPELINLIRTKKVDKNTKWMSYWIFYFALMGWIISGAFVGPNKLSAALFANILCGFIYSFNLYFMYKYSGKQNAEKTSWFVLGGTLGLTTVLSVLGLCGLYLNWSVDKYTGQVLLILVPMFTTFAFLPQILKTFELKTFKALSINYVLTFIASNIVWIIYWIFMIIHGEMQTHILSALVWQCLSLLIYSTQLTMILNERKQEKLKQQKTA